MNTTIPFALAARRVRFHQGAAFGLALLLTIAAPRMFAQTDTGEIHGQVADSSGLAVPSAAISVEGPALLTPRSGTADSTGTYNFPQFPPGTYRLTYSATGFEKVVRENIRITPGFSAEVNIQLPVGAVTD